jgi:hypothetical protein
MKIAITCTTPKCIALHPTFNKTKTLPPHARAHRRIKNRNHHTHRTKLRETHKTQNHEIAPHKQKFKITKNRYLPPRARDRTARTKTKNSDYHHTQHRKLASIAQNRLYNNKSNSTHNRNQTSLQTGGDRK